jgi:hypothetical protein
LKSGATGVRLETSFFGIRAGDELLIEFEAMLVHGTASTMQADFRAISDREVDGVGAAQVLPPVALAGHFKWFRIPYLVRGRVAQGEGVLLRLGFDDPDAEVVLRRIVARVRSSNPRLRLRNQIVALRSQADFTKNLSLVQRSPIQPGFHGGRRLLSDGAIRFPELGTAEISWPSGLQQWAGFVAYLPAATYAQSVHVYYEVSDAPDATCSPGESTGTVGDDFTESGPASARTVNPPTAGAWRARFRTFPGVPGAKRLVRVDVGGEFEAVRARIRNVHFSLPRFDDVLDDRRPNQLDEIYPDLGLMLSP